ncbi:hypothetical protein CPB85DRAFT_1259612 [Mucidula mucida]|nr:hypothetical protein CPB85DRAFT_1259612 [Mucidula mucida]
MAHTADTTTSCIIAHSTWAAFARSRDFDLDFNLIWIWPGTFWDITLDGWDVHPFHSSFPPTFTCLSPRPQHRDLIIVSAGTLGSDCFKALAASHVITSSHGTTSTLEHYFLVDFINDEHDVDTVGHIFAIIMRDYYLIIVSTMTSAFDCLPTSLEASLADFDLGGTALVNGSQDLPLPSKSSRVFPRIGFFLDDFFDTSNFSSSTASLSTTHNLSSIDQVFISFTVDDEVNAASSSPTDISSKLPPTCIVGLGDTRTHYYVGALLFASLTDWCCIAASSVVSRPLDSICLPGRYSLVRVGILTPLSKRRTRLFGLIFDDLFL